MDTNEINRQILNLIRKGAIMAVDHDAEMCRVSSGELQTNWIRWLSMAAGQTTDWNPPTVGEQVLLLCPGGDPADGVALRGIYSDTAPAPSHSQTTHTRKFPDGAVIEYDHEAHGLTATLPAGGTVMLIAPASVEVHTAVATIYADTVNVPNGDVVASGISLLHHVHGATMPGPGTTGEPQ